MTNSIFPEEMLKTSSSDSSFTIESIASKLGYFLEQIKFIHWRTKNNSEHEVLDALHSHLDKKRDKIVEELMGYEGRIIENVKVIPIDPKLKHNEVVKALEEYAHNLYEWAEDKGYCGIERNSQKISEKCAKSLYLLTQE